MAFRHLGNKAAAEDAVLDALLAAYQHISQFRGQAKLSTWVSAMVIHSAGMLANSTFRWMELTERRDTISLSGCPLSGRILKLSIARPNCGSMPRGG